jgi:hypothetical protein
MWAIYVILINYSANSALIVDPYHAFKGYIAEAELKLTTKTELLAIKGPSTRARFCIRITVRFLARFAYEWPRVLILLHTLITTACQHISGNISRKLNC